ncbi:MAG TPA: NADH-quinone oxidoreductase subunit L [Blastocatellia bacterium]|nr:NADH-quinone oxidoreductase subunit L [Blastocatellia bacterium]
MEFHNEPLLAFIVLAPLVGAAILGLIGKNLGERLIGVIACSTVAVSALLSIYVFINHRVQLEQGHKFYNYLFTWIRVGSFRADTSLLLDSLSAIYILFITFVAFWIHVFATGYMRGDPGYWRFFAYMNLFMFSMLTLVLGDNFLMMFVGWEGVGLCSYLLIGYYFTKDFANDAAKKAFIVNRIGDFGFVLGVMLLFLQAGSIFYFDDPARGIHGAFNWVLSQHADPLNMSAIFSGGITTIGVLLFVGATGKSAQLPLYVWLPDAMAGPTPVSALIHAATMVTAGVYMVARASSIYTHAPAAMVIIAFIGAATALFAATIGLAQWDIKKVLAYSTISQLGYMFLACGVGAFGAGIFHVFTHAFFKALLFLGAGSVIIGMHHEQDMRRMGGLKKYMRVTCLTMLAGWLAISGFPLFSGFFSKDEILFRTFTSPVLPAPWSKILWFVAAVTALLTAIYMTRLIVLTFWGGERFKEAGAAHSSGHPAEGDAHSVTPHESPAAMVLPLVVLAAGAVLVGFLGIPDVLSFGKTSNYFEHLIAPSVHEASGHMNEGHSGGIELEDQHGVELSLMLTSTVVALVGLGLGWFWFKRNPLWKPPRLLEDKYYVDELYDGTVVQPIKAGSTNVLWKFIDVRIIDGAVNGAGQIASLFGTSLRYVQSGLARSYVAVLVLGALLIIGYFVIR